MDWRGDGVGRRVEWFVERYDALAGTVQSFLRGKDEVVRAALVCVFAEGHLLIEDVPGVGKTTLAKALARSIDADMRRVQFTPDLLPADIIGVQVYDDGAFTFRRGPVFANVVLADEIDRASPKTQSALLEVMQEQQVTVDGTTHHLARPFVVIATANPIEHEGVYRLPEAQLDRFLMRIVIGYPAAQAEREVIDGHLQGRSPAQLTAVLSIDDVREMISIARSVHVSTALQHYIVDVVAATRALPDCRLGVSPRGSVGLAVAAQATAATDGRPYATADDVKQVASSVLAHRLVLRPEARHAGRTAEHLVEQVLSTVAVPKERVS